MQPIDFPFTTNWFATNFPLLSMLGIGIVGMVVSKGKGDLNTLIEQLTKEDDPKVRKQVITDLAAQFNDSNEAWNAVVKAANEDSKTSVRVTAINTLIAFKVDPFVMFDEFKSIINTTLLSVKEIGVTAAVISAIGNLGLEEGISYLKGLVSFIEDSGTFNDLEKEDLLIEIQGAVASLEANAGFTGSFDQVDQYLKDLKSTDPDVRKHVINELGKYDDPKIKDALLDILEKDTDQEVVEIAILALSRYTEQNVLDVLIDIVKQGFVTGDNLRKVGHAVNAIAFMDMREGIEILENFAYAEHEYLGELTEEQKHLIKIAKDALDKRAYINKDMGENESGAVRIPGKVVSESEAGEDFDSDNTVDIAALSKAAKNNYKYQPRMDHTPGINGITRDLTSLSAQDNLDPVIGRDNAINKLIGILAKSKKHNAALVGEPGVGKRSIVVGLAQKIAQGNVPKFLKGTRIVELDVEKLLSSKEALQKLPIVISELKRSKGSVILFINDFHSIVPCREDPTDLISAFKPYMASGEITVIGTTTGDQYRNRVEADKSLIRTLEAMLIEEPANKETLSILKGLKSIYSKLHGVTYTQKAIEAIAYLSARYIKNSFMPDKAVDLMDASGAKAKLKGQKRVTDKTVREAVSEKTGIPLGSVKNDREKYLNLESYLGKRVIGQNKAITAISEALRIAQAGIKKAKGPIASFLFVGPPGVGKTEVARSLSEVISGTEDKLIRLDMSEFSEKHTVSRLIGSPPSYVGFEEGGQLTEKVRNNAYSVILLDEIEKAHPNVLNLLLQMLDDGHLTDGRGRKVDFTNTIVLMTSNLGNVAGEESKKTVVGFGEKTPASDDEVSAQRHVQAAKNELRPELFDRLTKTIPFHKLTLDQKAQVLDLKLTDLAARVKENAQITLIVGQNLKSKILDILKDSTNPGARGIDRAITEEIETPLSKELLSSNHKKNTKLTIDIDEDGQTKIAQKKPKAKKSGFGKTALSIAALSSIAFLAMMFGAPEVADAATSAVQSTDPSSLGWLSTLLSVPIIGLGMAISSKKGAGKQDETAGYWIKELQDRMDWPSRFKAIEILSIKFNDDPRASGAVVTVATNRANDHQFRLAAINALGSFRNKQALAALKSLVSDYLMAMYHEYDMSQYATYEEKREVAQKLFSLAGQAIIALDDMRLPESREYLETIAFEPLIIDGKHIDDQIKALAFETLEDSGPYFKMPGASKKSDEGPAMRTSGKNLNRVQHKSVVDTVVGQAFDNGDARSIEPSEALQSLLSAALKTPSVIASEARQSQTQGSQQSGKILNQVQDDKGKRGRNDKIEKILKQVRNDKSGNFSEQDKEYAFFDPNGDYFTNGTKVYEVETTAQEIEDWAMKSGVSPPADIVAHAGRTRNQAYYFSHQKEYLQNLAPKKRAQVAKHEIAHINNPTLSEAQVLAIAPLPTLGIKAKLLDFIKSMPKGSWPLILGSITLQFGFEIIGTASIMYAQTLTGGVMILTYMAIVRIAMSTLAGAVGGPLGDKVSTKKFLIFTHLLLGIPLVAIAGLNSIGVITAGIFLTLMAFFYFGRAGFIGGMGGVATQTAVSEISGADSVASEKINSMMKVLLQIPGFLGPIIGSALIVTIHASATFAATPAIFLVGIIPFMFLPLLLKKDASEGRTGFFEKITKGFTETYKNPQLRWPFAFYALITLMHLAFYSLLSPMYTTYAFPDAPEMLGWLRGAYSLGGGLGALMSRFNPFNLKIIESLKQMSLAKWTAIGMLALPLYWGMGAMISSPLIITALIGFYGFLTVPAGIKLFSAMQARSPEEAKGRIMGAVSLLTSFIALVNLVLLGGVFEALGATTFPIMAAAVSGLSILGLSVVHKLNNNTTAPASPRGPPPSASVSEAKQSPPVIASPKGAAISKTRKASDQKQTLTTRTSNWFKNRFASFQRTGNALTGFPANLKDKTVILAGVMQGRENIIRRIQNMGVKVVLLGKAESTGKTVADDFIEVPMGDDAAYDSIVDTVEAYAKTHKVDGVVNFMDTNVILNVRIAKRLGLTRHAVYGVQYAKDKSAMRGVTGDKPYATKFYDVESIDDIKFAIERTGLPAVIKPPMAAASRGVYVVHSLSQARAIYRQINEWVKSLSEEKRKVYFPKFDETKGQPVLVEEFLTQSASDKRKGSDEVDIEMLVQDGQIKFAAIGDNFHATEGDHRETINSHPSRLSWIKKRKLMNMAKDVVKQLKLENGSVHLEAMITKNGPRIIEVNPRMGGTLTNTLVKEAWGVDLVEENVKIALDVPIPDRTKIKPIKTVIGRWFFSQTKGKVARLRGFENFEGNEGYDLRLTKKEGDEIGGREAGYAGSVGFALISGKNYKQAKTRLNKLLEETEFEVEPAQTNPAKIGWSDGGIAMRLNKAEEGYSKAEHDTVVNPLIDNAFVSKKAKLIEPSKALKENLDNAGKDGNPTKEKILKQVQDDTKNVYGEQDKEYAFYDPTGEYYENGTKVYEIETTKKEIKKLAKESGLDPPTDMVAHAGRSRNQIYYFSTQKKALQQYNIEERSQITKHEIAHIDNPTFTEKQVREIAPLPEIKPSKASLYGFLAYFALVILGISFYITGLPFFIREWAEPTMDNPTTYVGIARMVHWASYLLLSVPVGVWISKRDTLKVLIQSNFWRAFLVAAVPAAFVLLVMPLNIPFTIGFPVFLTIVLANVVFQSAMSIAIGASWTRLVQKFARDDGHRRKLNSIKNFMLSGMGIFGAAIAGFSITAFESTIGTAMASVVIGYGSYAVFLLLSALVAKIFISKKVFAATKAKPKKEVEKETQEDEDVKAKKPGRFSQMFDGARIIMKTPFLRNRVLMSMVAMFFAGDALTNVLLPIYVQDVLNGTPALFGTIGSAEGAGILIGTLLVMSKWGKKARFNTVFRMSAFGMLFVWGLILPLAGVAISPFVLLPIIFFSMGLLIEPLANVLEGEKQKVEQRLSQEELQKVISTESMLSPALTMLGVGAFTVLLWFMTPQSTMFVSAGAFTLMAAIEIFGPKILFLYDKPKQKGLFFSLKRWLIPATAFAYLPFAITQAKLFTSEKIFNRHLTQAFYARLGHDKDALDEALEDDKKDVAEEIVAKANALEIPANELKQAQAHEIKWDSREEADKYISKAKKIFLEGKYVPHFLFGGAATRLGLGPMYFMDLAQIGRAVLGLPSTLNEEQQMAVRLDFANLSAEQHEELLMKLREVGESLKTRLGLGPRQLIEYRLFLESLAKEAGVPGDEVIKNARFVMHIPETGSEAILKDLMDHKFYGFSRENVYFVKPPSTHGYKINMGHIELDETSLTLPTGHGHATMQLVSKGGAFKLDADGMPKKVKKSVLAELEKQGAQIMGTHRINDLTRLTEDIVDVEKLAFSLRFMGDPQDLNNGNNMMVELVANPNNQKGGFWAKDKRTGKKGLAESLNLKTPELQKFLSGLKNAPYNAFRNIYSIKALRKSLTKYGLPIYIRLSRSRLYADSVSGDATNINEMDSEAFFKANETIHDFKELKNMAEALPFILEQDSRLANRTETVLSFQPVDSSNNGSSGALQDNQTAWENPTGKDSKQGSGDRVQKERAASGSMLNRIMGALKKKLPLTSDKNVSASPTSRAAYLKGNITDKKVIKRELKDKRFTAVFDLNQTLEGHDDAVDPDDIRLRPGTIENLKDLKNSGIKIVLWTQAETWWVEKFFAKYPETAQYFDLVITGNNYVPNVEEYNHTNTKNFEKDITILGYDVIVDDNAKLESTAREKGFFFVGVSPYTPESNPAKDDELTQAAQQVKRIAAVINSKTIPSESGDVAIKDAKADIKEIRASLGKKPLVFAINRSIFKTDFSQSPPPSLPLQRGGEREGEFSAQGKGEREGEFSAQERGERKGEGRSVLQIERSPGGAAPAIYSALEENKKGIVFSAAITETEKMLARKNKVLRVGKGIWVKYIDIAPEEFDQYYNGFANSLLWPVSHEMLDEFIVPVLSIIMGNLQSIAHHIFSSKMRNNYQSYKNVNALFADEIVSVLGNKLDASRIMLQDYHLYLLPELLRKKSSSAIMQQFVHIPWADPEYIERAVAKPVLKELLEGILGIDILGMQTPQNVEKFLMTVSRNLDGAKADFKEGTVEFQGRVTQVKAYPISVNVENLQNKLDDKNVADYIKRLKRAVGDRKIFARVDRIDPSKGISESLKAYDLMLEKHPELVGKVSFLAILQPSRQDNPAYKKLSNKVKKQITSINQKYSPETLTSDFNGLLETKQEYQKFLNGSAATRAPPTVVGFMNGAPHPEVLGTAALADVIVINPKADGMNLVAKEAAVANSPQQLKKFNETHPSLNLKPAVIVASSKMGAYDELKEGVVTIKDPLNIEETSDALYKGLELNEKGWKDQAKAIGNQVIKNNLFVWLDSMISDLGKAEIAAKRSLPWYYTMFYAANSLIMFGGGLVSVMFPMFAIALTGSATAMVVVSLFKESSDAAAAISSGSVTDTYSLKKTYLASLVIQVIAAAMQFGLAALFITGTLSGAIVWPAIIALMIVSTMAFNFNYRAFTKIQRFSEHLNPTGASNENTLAHMDARRWAFVYLAMLAGTLTAILFFPAEPVLATTIGLGVMAASLLASLIGSAITLPFIKKDGVENENIPNKTGLSMKLKKFMKVFFVDGISQGYKVTKDVILKNKTLKWDTISQAYETLASARLFIDSIVPFIMATMGLGYKAVGGFVAVWLAGSVLGCFAYDWLARKLYFDNNPKGKLWFTVSYGATRLIMAPIFIAMAISGFNPLWLIPLFALNFLVGFSGAFQHSIVNGVARDNINKEHFGMTDGVRYFFFITASFLAALPLKALMELGAIPTMVTIAVLWAGLGLLQLFVPQLYDMKELKQVDGFWTSKLLSIFSSRKAKPSDKGPAMRLSGKGLEAIEHTEVVNKVIEWAFKMGKVRQVRESDKDYAFYDPRNYYAKRKTKVWIIDITEEDIIDFAKKSGIDPPTIFSLSPGGRGQGEGDASLADIVVHVGRTTNQVYYFNHNIQYIEVFNKSQRAQITRHEIAHIDNPIKSEEEIQAIAPLPDLSEVEWVKEARKFDYILVRGFMSEYYASYMNNFIGIMKRLGLSAGMSAIKSYMPNDENAKTLRDEVMASSKKVVLVGHSKGGLDIMTALEKYPQIREKISKVLLIQSPVKGSFIADKFSKGIPGKVAGTFLKLMGSEPRVIPEMSTYYRESRVKKWSKVAEQVPVFIVRSQLAHSDGRIGSVLWRVSRLRGSEPSDGLITLSAQNLEGAQGTLDFNGASHADTVVSNPWRILFGKRAPSSWRIAKDIIKWITTATMAVAFALALGAIMPESNPISQIAMAAPLVIGMVRQSNSADSFERLAPRVGITMTNKAKKRYNKLTKAQKKQADKAIEAIKNDPIGASKQLKVNDGLRSTRINQQFRIIFDFDKKAQTARINFIGPHNDYDKALKSEFSIFKAMAFLGHKLVDLFIPQLTGRWAFRKWKKELTPQDLNTAFDAISRKRTAGTLGPRKTGRDWNKETNFNYTGMIFAYTILRYLPFLDRAREYFIGDGIVKGEILHYNNSNVQKGGTCSLHAMVNFFNTSAIRFKKQPQLSAEKIKALDPTVSYSKVKKNGMREPEIENLAKKLSKQTGIPIKFLSVENAIKEHSINKVPIYLTFDTGKEQHTVVLIGTKFDEQTGKLYFIILDSNSKNPMLVPADSASWMLNPVNSRAIVPDVNAIKAGFLDRFMKRFMFFPAKMFGPRAKQQDNSNNKHKLSKL
ncbi:MFS transporter [Elusimicrobiota bacterium]